ncbi:hypothetical protein [Halioxenophilus sp. WMMB6]|uniref:hypothetical protein n=1 Tax=Halioxenophilus sp. WMMB6 TaxID=3073815 RepID=UPI00295F04F1|nr:hypothetical protein [Halioxenophilus sp. WMMB6]
MSTNRVGNQPGNRRARLAQAALLLCLMGSLSALAQTTEEPDSQAAEAPPATSNSGTDKANANPAPTEPGGDYEDFVPSEEISEDLSVSFPVDI